MPDADQYPADLGEAAAPPGEALAADPFDTADVRADLAGRSARGGTAIVAGQLASFVLGFGTTAILARHVAPADFGLITMVTALTGFAGMFRDLGLGLATLQVETLTRRAADTLFWLSAGLGTTVAAVTVAASPLIVWYNGNEPRLYGITFALSFSFILSGLTLQHQAVLKRQMRFGTLSRITVSSNVIGAIFGIVLALPPLRLGYWALVAMPLAVAGATLVQSWASVDWRPGPPRRDSEVGRLIAFGANFSGFQFVNYFSRNFDNILIGRWFGETALGFYVKAYSLLLLPINQISAPVANVATSALSRLQQEPEQFRRYHLKVLWLAALCSAPVIAVLMSAGGEVIMTMLGPNWDEAVPIFQVLALAAPLQPLLNSTGWLFVSTGRTRAMFRAGVVNAIFMCCAFVVGLQYGVIGIAAAFSAAQWIAFLPLIFVAHRNTPVSVGDFFRTISPPYALALIAGVGGWVAKTLVPNGWHAAAALAVAGVTVMGLYAVGAVLLLDARRKLSPLLRELRKGR